MRSPKYQYHPILAAALFALCFVFSTALFAQEKQIKRIVTFGTSLSDSGNAFVLLSDPSGFGFEGCDMGTPANTPPYDALDELLVPVGSYAKGGHHVTNGAAWIEQLARGKGLSGNARPALRNTGIQANNYAVGGARASDFDCRFNLEDQLNAYLNDSSETSAETLVIVEMGSNDVRDALVALANSQDPSPIIGAALFSIGNAIQELYSHGARKFLLVNIPAVGKTPAVKILDDLLGSSGAVIAAANSLTEAFNSELEAMQGGLSGLPGIDVRTLDLYTLLNEIIDDPASYGIINTEDACVTPNVSPFQCKKPDTYLFWDGVHPTKVVQRIIAQKAAEVLITTTQ